MFEMGRPYDIIENMYHGGQGIIYKCWHFNFGDCVIKQIKDDYLYREEEARQLV